MGDCKVDVPSLQACLEKSDLTVLSCSGRRERHELGCKILCMELAIVVNDGRVDRVGNIKYTVVPKGAGKMFF